MSYEQLESVRELEHQSILMDYFEECYLKKLKVAYLPQLKAADVTFFKDLTRQLGFARAKQAIVQFFKLDTFLTKTRGHTVPVLKMELNTVNVALGKQEDQGTLDNAINQLRIKTWVSCDTPGCNKSFEVVVAASTYSFKDPLLCSSCKTPTQ